MFERNAARKQWETLPLEWDRERVADRPRTVTRNWAQMTETMRQMVRDAAQGGRVTLVDVGCAEGGFADGLDAVLDRYIGIDPSETMLRKRRQRNDSLYLRGVGEQLPLADGSADVVVLKSVLAHCYDPLKVVQEGARVLRHGGLLLIGTNNGRAWYQGLKVWRRRRLHHDSSSDGHLFALDAKRLRKLVQSAGLRFEMWIPMGYLVLPHAIERWLSDAWLERFGSLADNWGKCLFPHRSGALIVSARKSERL